MKPHNRLWPSLDRPKVLTFAPLAWLKLQFFCHAGDTEIGGFGIARPDNPLYIEEFVTVKQQVTPVTVRFSDEDVANYFDRCVDRGLKPESFSRVWLHSHPAESVTPSTTDEETLVRCFGRCDWALMFILGRTAKTYARLAFHVGPGTQVVIPTQVDWSAWPREVSDPLLNLETLQKLWQGEYVANVQALPNVLTRMMPNPRQSMLEDPGEWDDYLWSPELDELRYELVENPDHEPAIRTRST